MPQSTTSSLKIPLLLLFAIAPLIWLLLREPTQNPEKSPPAGSGEANVATPPAGGTPATPAEKDSQAASTPAEQPKGPEPKAGTGTRPATEPGARDGAETTSSVPAEKGAGAPTAPPTPAMAISNTPKAAASTPAPPSSLPTEPTNFAEAPAAATKEHPFINGLGQEYVPVPETNVLFCRTDVRVRDFQQYANEASYRQSGGACVMKVKQNGQNYSISWQLDANASWEQPGFEQTGDHPVVCVSWEDAKAFCEWLSEKEGRTYRLPSDHEWSCAVGLGDREHVIGWVHPWGTQWPPPKGSGNYFESLQVDGFRYTSPVGSFAPNRFGLFDMGGNVWQWCQDRYLNPNHPNLDTMRVLRGASWADYNRDSLASWFINGALHTARNASIGFRCVLVVSGAGAGTPAPAPPTLAAKQNSPNLPVSPPRPAEEPEAFATPPASATKEHPFVNSLGMRFVPVAVTWSPISARYILFSVWDTRVQDYEVFASETKREWPKAAFEQEPTHPAVNVSWEDAQLFCEWLTAREHRGGRLPFEFEYRLPGDHEWTCAVGLGTRESVAQLPSEKDGKITDVFPWGTRWPPPKGAGNYYGSLDVDPFKNTSPVGSFAANPYGLFDMGGNVWQWCQDWYDSDQNSHVLRGASWNGNERDGLLSSARNRYAPSVRHADNGFRCVLAEAGTAGPLGSTPPTGPSTEPESAGASAGSSSGPRYRTAEFAVLLHAFDVSVHTIDDRAPERYLRKDGTSYAMPPGPHFVEVAYSFGLTHSVKPVRVAIAVKPGHFYDILAMLNPRLKQCSFQFSDVTPFASPDGADPGQPANTTSGVRAVGWIETRLLPMIRTESAGTNWSYSNSVPLTYHVLRCPDGHDYLLRFVPGMMGVAFASNRTTRYQVDGEAAAIPPDYNPEDMFRLTEVTNSANGEVETRDVTRVLLVGALHPLK